MEQVVIIGTGCAGLTAAIYTARANLSPLVLTGTMPGGLLTTTSIVENFPGFPEGIDGCELMQNLQKQAERFGARVKFGHLDSVDFSGQPLKLVIDGDPFETRTVIVATGGDSAVEEATYLTRFASKVYLVHRRDSLRASVIMQERALHHPKIEMVWNSIVTEVLDVAQKKVTGVKRKNIATGEASTLACGGLFVAIGHTPNTAVFKGALDTDEQGYLKLHGGTRTNVPGVFAAGDVADSVYRQAITAAGTGCAAAIEAERYLESLECGRP